MRPVKLADASVVVFDAQLNIRHLLQQSLQVIGFGHIRCTGTVDRLRQLIEVENPDLILVDMDTDRDLLCRTIEDVRNRRLCSNPFVVVIAMTWNAARGTVTVALGAGTDDIVAKPVSANILRDRVTNLVHNRKEFVVTPTYLGPDRRGRDRHPSENDLPTIRVPNSLRHKALKDPMAAVDEDKIVAALRSLSVQKIYRQALDFSRLATDLEQLVEERPEASVPPAAVSELETLLGDIERTIAQVKLRSLHQIVATTRTVLGDLKANAANARPRQLELLDLQGRAIAAALKENDEAAGLLVSALGEAAEAVTSYAKTA